MKHIVLLLFSAVALCLMATPAAAQCGGGFYGGHHYGGHHRGYYGHRGPYYPTFGVGYYRPVYAHPYRHYGYGPHYGFHYGRHYGHGHGGFSFGIRF